MAKTRPARRQKENLVEKAVAYLTREILSDRLRPNQRISELAVCQELGISRSPVREALRILERDGLVKQGGKRGMVVADITPEEADELYLIHGHLLGLAVRLACQRMRSEDLSRMGELVEKLKAAAGENDRHGFLDARAELERFIIERSFSPRLAHLLEVMSYPSARYRVFHVSVPGYMGEVSRCYEGIYRAFRKKDEREAERLRLKIMELGRDMLRQYFIEPYARLKGQQRSSPLP
ncbi:MAG TPA: GntR family transcriptional regulator [Candidatus Acidoferrales bacterium]|nr:GntR family transcriptional regulator [Candidatus Acidoferrales bacterium]